MLENLNENQKKAILKTQGPLIIIAGPGTGKTKTLTTKIAYLILHEKIDPQNIVALTFTKKAAAEMKERVYNLVENTTTKDIQKITIATFHSLCFQILSRNNPNLKIITENEQIKYIRSIYESKKTSNYQNIEKNVQKIKNSLLNKEKTTREEEEIRQEYKEFLHKNNLCDYDTLIENTINKIKNNNLLRNELKEKIKYLLIDEFQDTNNEQYELIQLILNNEKNIMVIGDPLQSIYGFRGSNAKIFNTFKNDFPNALEITLDINYRSTKEIIKTSHALFPNTTQIKAHTTTRGTVTIINTYNEYTEADYIVEYINNLIGGTDLHSSQKTCKQAQTCSFSDFAVIYRTHAIKKPLEQALNKSGIPYQVIGGESFFENENIRLIINVLKYINNKDDNNEETIQTLEKSKIQTIKETIKQQDTLITILQKINDTIFPKLINSPQETLQINQLIATALQFQSHPNPIHSLINYYDEITQNEYYDPHADKITLATMHAAKGLEFKYVCIIGFEEGIIPYTQNEKRKKTQQQNENTIEKRDEEKRLLYVAITRAKEELTLTYTKFRARTKTTISSFAAELNTETITKKSDENIEKIEQRMKIKKEKKKQLQLF